MPHIPASRPARLAFVIGLFAAITAGRFASHNAADAIGVLFVIPTAMLALEFGWRGGVVGGVLGTSLTAVWANIENQPVTIVGYSSRLVAFVVVGVGIGVLTVQKERSAREAERWFVMSNDLLCTASFEGYFTHVNDRWTALLGWSCEELLASPFESFVHPDDIQKTRQTAAGLAVPSEIVNFENRYRAKDGSWHWLLWSARSDGECIYAAVKDVTVRKQEEADREELLRAVGVLASTDSLTGTMNRASWHKQLADELVRSARSGPPPSVLMLDLDRFKELNDTQGHAAGDRMLKAAAGGWGGALRASDQLGRLGGDEFAILLPQCGVDDAMVVAERVRAATPAGITCSLGLARWDGIETADSLLHRADTSLYRAKATGRDTLAV
jgi:diguanylate cyclase (GGDEF)-like protein/PAS domain S-box-containing protein